MNNNEISTWDRDSNEKETREKMYDASLEFEERIPTQKETKQCQKISLTKSKNHKSPKRKQSTPKFKNKKDYLLWVNAKDCIKDKIIGLYSLSVKQTPKQVKQPQTKTSNTKNKLEKEQNFLLKIYLLISSTTS